MIYTAVDHKIDVFIVEAYGQMDRQMDRING
jgi:hypothetical protein